MPRNVPNFWLYCLPLKRRVCSAQASAVLCALLIAAGGAAGFFCAAAQAQQVRCGEPCSGSAGCARQAEQETPGVHNGKAATAVASRSRFHARHDHMHHAQAVEMTALISFHTENKDLRLLGARISSSQSDEIKFMKRWLAARGEPVSMAMASMKDMDMSHNPMPLMPGMLTPEQMEALRKAKGSEFRPPISDGNDSAP